MGQQLLAAKQVSGFKILLLLLLRPNKNLLIWRVVQVYLHSPLGGAAGFARGTIQSSLLGRHVQWPNPCLPKHKRSKLHSTFCVCSALLFSDVPDISRTCILTCSFCKHQFWLLKLCELGVHIHWPRLLFESGRSPERRKRCSLYVTATNHQAPGVIVAFKPIVGRNLEF